MLPGIYECTDAIFVVLILIINLFIRNLLFLVFSPCCFLFPFFLLFFLFLKCFVLIILLVLVVLVTPRQHQFSVRYEVGTKPAPDALWTPVHPPESPSSTMTTSPSDKLV